MKKTIVALTLFLICAVQAMAQSFDLTGTVTDEKGEPLVGASIVVKDRPGMGVVTDIDGNFKVKNGEVNMRLIVSYIGFDTQTIRVADNKPLKIVLKETKDNVLDEVTVTGLGREKKITMTGAVSTVNPEDLKIPTASVANSLAGNVPGVFARQMSGQPGRNVSEFWIRGISTFGGGSSALVLVDGFERDINQVNVEDIETFTVLKDASATAIYGSRGANGVILITTKHGKEGKVHINAKAEYSYNTRSMTPEFVDGSTYARMLNEAHTTRNEEAAYSDNDLYLIDTGLDPDLFANVNWMKLLMKRGAPTYRGDLEVSGGGSLARYYFSTSYIDEGGMYKVDKDMKKDYNTNADYRRWTYRLNVDVNITRTTLLSFGVAGSLDKRNEPGGSYEAIWNALARQNPISVPVKYSNGYIASNGGGYHMNPWVLITQMGYSQNWNNKVQTTFNLSQDLSFITKGLNFYARFGYDSNTQNTDAHTKSPETWLAERQRDNEGHLVFTKTSSEQLMTADPHSYGDRYETFEAELHWDRKFMRNIHNFGAVLKYSVDKKVDNSENPSKNYIQDIDHRHQGIAGRFTYGYKNRYLFDFNFGYNGSENFAKHHQYGFFPAYSVAWNLGEEPFIQKKLPWMEMFKIRYSYGKVGNDNLGTDRFPYHAAFQNTYAYDFGTVNSGYTYNGLTYSTLSSPYVTWEIAKKHDLGIDFSFFHNDISGTIDYFNERRTGIYMARNYQAQIIGIPDLSSSFKSNYGEVKSEGFDGNIGLHHKFGQVDVTLRGNITYSKNTIEQYDEELSRYPYNKYVGHRVGYQRGLVALGLFQSYEEIRESPKQNFGGVDVAPGDVKYKDVNGDGIIDDNDEVAIGATARPNTIYGFGVSALWKGIDFNVHFQGAGKSSIYLEGILTRPFANEEWGNVSSDLIGNYWSLGTNENPNAKYPRLTYGWNYNNYRRSTYWMRDGSYLRLKTLEIGYTLPKQFTTPLRMSKVRVYFMGTNLLTFSSFKLWDPELGDGFGMQYPLSRTYTVGLTINM